MTATGPAAAPRVGTRAGISVLIVDQHPAFAQGLWSILEAAGGFAPIASVASGGDALKILARHKPQIVTIGLGLRDLAAAELCRELRTAAPHARVVLFTDPGQGATLDSCLGIRPSVVLLRDADDTEIVAALRRLTNGWSMGPTHREVVNEAEESRTHSLTERECEMLRLAARGLTSREIAVVMSLAPNTVRSYCQDVLRKLGARNRIHALEIARSLRLL